MRGTLVALIVAAGACAAQAKPKPKEPPVTGTAVPEFADVDKLALEFLAEQGPPGMAVAIAKDGRLLYARGFGYADPDKKLPVQPTSLFRLASVSKVITAAAICQLVDREKLKFEDNLLDILKFKNLPAKMDPRWKQIKVVYLYTHSAGFDRDASGDPMFKSIDIARSLHVPSPPSRDQVIRYMLQQPLDFDPGSKESYSNFGYLLLGRVIEKIGGKPYDKYVSEELLKPLGITEMRLGKTLTAAKGEVKYVENKTPVGPSVFSGNLRRPVPSPYGAWYLEAMDSHGGWISSIVDLARFASAFDAPDKFPAYRGVNLQGRFSPEYYFTGSIDGTSSEMHRLNGLVFVALFNARTGRNEKNLAEEWDPRIKELLGKIKKWPEGDQFKNFYK